MRRLGGSGWLWVACVVCAIQSPTARAESPQPSAADVAPLAVTDPALLAELERRGLALHRLLGVASPDTAGLHAASAFYRDFAELVALDDSVAKWRDPKAGVGFAPAHRLFDIRWLSSSRTHFELIGVINRVDRRFATPGRCGELRFIYRLAYATSHISSRLPLTLNLVYLQGEDCRSVARRWLALQRRTAAELPDALLEGPLRERGAPVRVDTNFQSGRWPSSLRPSLGGHAEYVLRSFTVENGRLQLSTLESTPTQKLGASGRSELRRWIAENVQAIDAGEVVLPGAFLAERSVAVEPRGIARLANRAFSQIVGGAAEGVPASALRTTKLVRSRAGLMRRLDQLTCKGCHASRSLAGFHLLGEDRASTPSLNAVAVGLSPHLLAQLSWRRGDLEALARGEVHSEPRPFADRGTGRGLSGEACGLGDATFADWTCAAGLTCRNVHGDLVGACTPRAGNGLGDGVESGTLTQSRDGLKDFVQRPRVEACRRDHPGERAALSKNGFPGGMCHAPCPAFGVREGDAICGPVPFGRGTEFEGFTHCLAQHRQPFERCLADDTHPTWLRACDRETPCRDDYLCVRVPGSQPSAAGACLPPYFLFQVRVDGHFPERW